MNFGTHKEFRERVKLELAAGKFKEAAAVLLENPEATTSFWLDWAFRVVSGQLTPSRATLPTEPVEKQEHLYGEPITTGRRKRGV